MFSLNGHIVPEACEQRPSAGCRPEGEERPVLPVTPPKGCCGKIHRTGVCCGKYLRRKKGSK